MQNTGIQALTVNTSPVQNPGALVYQTPRVFSPVQNTGIQALTVNTSPVQNSEAAVNTSQDQHIFYQQNVVTPTGQVLYQMTFPANDNQLAEAASPPASYSHPTNKRITTAGTFVPTFTAVS